MVFRVIVDCHLADPITPKRAAFVTTQFVESPNISSAGELAIKKTKSKMLEKGYNSESVEMASFIIEEAEKLESGEVDCIIEESFIYYDPTYE